MEIFGYKPDALTPLFVMTALTFIVIFTNIAWDWITPKSKYLWLFTTVWCAGFLFAILSAWGIIKIGA